MIKRFIPILGLIFIIIFSIHCGNTTTEKPTDNPPSVQETTKETPPTATETLWPEIQPYQTGYLQVSEIHKLFYQLGGTPEGKPVMVLHGGPGAGCWPAYFRYFNPAKFHIILHDQRGASQSTPFAELKDNTTQALVSDIEALRQHLKLGKVILFGGSWGSTLALAYAETYPQNVAGMVIRGVFLATRKEIDHFYHGGAAVFFPEVHQKLADLMPQPNEKTYPQQLLGKLKDADPAVRQKYAKAWAVYETRISCLTLTDEEVEAQLQGWDPYAFSLIENYYMANGCFLKEGQLLNEADKLRDIPITIVNGRYDSICPPVTAYRLHQRLPHSKLIIAEAAGHSSSEEPIRKELVNAMKAFE